MPSIVWRLEKFSLWIQENWLATAFFALILPIREVEYYAAGMIVVGICGLIFSECRIHAFSSLIAVLSFIAYGQYLSINNTRGIELTVMILIAISTWVGHLNYSAVARLMRQLSWLPIPILALQLIIYFTGHYNLDDLFSSRELGGLTPAQTAAFVGILTIASIFKLYCKLKRPFRVAPFLLNVASIISCFVMAFATSQRTAYLIPAFSVILYFFVRGLTSSRVFSRVVVSCVFIVIVVSYLVFALYLPTIWTIKFGFMSSEYTRVDALHCVTASALQSPASFLFGHGFGSLSSQCSEVFNSSSGLLRYRPLFTEFVFSRGHAHNLVAQVVFNMGVPLGVMLCLVLFGGCRNIFNSLMSRSKRSSMKAGLVSVMFIFCLVNSMVEVSFLKVPALALVYGLIFGAALNFDKPREAFAHRHLEGDCL